KSGKGTLRLAFDTRAANEGFEPPPKTTLPTSAAWAALESEHPAVVAQGDIQRAFYHVAARHGEVLHASDHLIDCWESRRPLASDCILQPMVRTFPTGWSWSLFFCQGILRRTLVQNGFSDECPIEDGRPSPALLSRSCAAAAGYVDNFAVAGGDAATVAEKRDMITRTLEDWGLPVHAIDEASSVPMFTGLEINGHMGTARAKPTSILRLRRAILAVLRPGAASPRMLE
ncbi:unnamed protein product, partial [Prorocentrum cordatum]